VLALTHYKNKTDTNPRPVTRTWEQLVESLRKPRVVPCTAETCVGKLCPHKNGQLWSPSSYADGKTRGNENVTALAALVLDIDHVADDALADIEGRLHGRRRIVHSTHGDVPNDRALRVVLALSRPVLASEYPALWRGAVGALDLPGCDPACKAESQMFYMPTVRTGAKYLFLVGEGDPLDVDAMIASAPKVPQLKLVGPSPETGKIEPGNRHASLTSLAGTMRRKGCDEATIYAALVTHNANHCNPPKPDDELREIARDIGKKPAPAQDSGPSYGSTALGDWLGSDEPDDDDSSDWHVRGIVAQDVIGFCAGDMKTGKTMLVEDVSIALARGAETWCGLPIYGRKRVLLMPREDAARTTMKRLWQLSRGHGLRSPHDIAEWLTVDPTSPLDLSNEKHVAALSAACERFDVVFIDSFATAHLGDENSVKDISRALGPARDIAASTKTAIVFIHHYNGKGNPEDKRAVKHRLRGSSAIGAYARHIVGASHGRERGEVQIASAGNLEYQLEPTLIRLARGETEWGKKTLRYELVGNATDLVAEVPRAEIDKLVRFVAKHPDGFKSKNGIFKIYGGNRGTTLGTIDAALRTDALQFANGRIVASTRNHSVPVGTSPVVPGTPPFRGVPEPGDTDPGDE